MEHVIRCTCGADIASKYFLYNEYLRKGIGEENALDDLDIQKSCCRTRLISKSVAPERVFRAATAQMKQEGKLKKTLDVGNIPEAENIDINIDTFEEQRDTLAKNAPKPKFVHYKVKISVSYKTPPIIESEIYKPVRKLIDGLPSTTYSAKLSKITVPKTKSFRNLEDWQLDWRFGETPENITNDEIVNEPDIIDFRIKIKTYTLEFTINNFNLTTFSLIEKINKELNKSVKKKVIISNPEFIIKNIRLKPITYKNLLENPKFKKFAKLKEGLYEIIVEELEQEQTKEQLNDRAKTLLVGRKIISIVEKDNKDVLTLDDKNTLIATSLIIWQGKEPVDSTNSNVDFIIGKRIITAFYSTDEINKIYDIKNSRLILLLDDDTLVVPAGQFEHSKINFGENLSTLPVIFENLFVEPDVITYTNLLKERDELIVVDFWADWCQPCLSIKPLFNQLPNKYSNVLFVSINIQDNKYSTLGLASITSLPTFKFFKNNKEVAQIIGANITKIEDKINDLEILKEYKYLLTITTTAPDNDPETLQETIDIHIEFVEAVADFLKIEIEPEHIGDDNEYYMQLPISEETYENIIKTKKGKVLKRKGSFRLTLEGFKAFITLKEIF